MDQLVQMLEAALNLLEEGVAVLDNREQIRFWSKAAACLTGYGPAEMLSRSCPRDLYRIDELHVELATAATGAREQVTTTPGGFGQSAAGYSDSLLPAKHALANQRLLEQPTLVSFRHRLGHAIPAMLRKVPLHDAFGTLLGSTLLFYQVEESNALPHGETGAGVGVERSQAEMEDRLDEAHHEWTTHRLPLGLQWITIDQAAQMRRTHGRDACESMFRTVSQTLLHGLRSGEIIGRWGTDEFLVVSHERTDEQLAERAHRLAGLARTAEFRWWGDRLTLTVSIGASQAREGEGLPLLLERTRNAMHTSLRAGGNHAHTDIARQPAQRESQCSQS